MTTPPPPDELDDRLIAALDALIPRYLQELRSAITDVEGSNRLTITQVRCLRTIAQEGDAGATTSRLAETLNVTVPTMSAMIDGFAGRELVERRVDPVNRRRVLLFVTPEGVELLARYQAIMNARHREIVGSLSAASKRRLLAAAGDLARQVERLATKSADGSGSIASGSEADARSGSLR